MTQVQFTLCPHGLVRELVVCRACLEDPPPGDASFQVLKGSLVVTRKLPRITQIPCEHSSERRRCKVCKGSCICVHDKNKVFCKVCDGRRLCQVCFEKTMTRCYEVCHKCKLKGKAGEGAELLESARRARQRMALCI